MDYFEPIFLYRGEPMETAEFSIVGITFCIKKTYLEHLNQGGQAIKSQEHIFHDSFLLTLNTTPPILLW